MTHWKADVRRSLLSAWRDAGLPPPEEFERAYCDTRASLAGRAPPTTKSLGPELDPELVRSVYAFGALIGRVACLLLDIPGGAAENGTDWCGRFNLGISLFDFLCDERGETQTLLSLAPFDRLGHPDRNEGPVEGSYDDAMGFLSHLASDLLDEVAVRVGPSGQSRDRMWFTLQRMLSAESFMANEAPAPGVPVKEIEGGLRLKSVEPFVVMADWVALGHGAGDAQTRTRARRLGRAIGRCFWLIDDATDVWADLRGARWNLLMIRALELDPSLDLSVRSAVTTLRLEKAVRRGMVLERELRRSLAALRRALAEAQVDDATRREAAGLLGAALAEWS